MIVGIGLDVVELERWARTLDKIQEQAFTRAELEACRDRADRVDALAARFAAKEACLKALQAGIRNGGLRQVEVLADESGAPTLRLSGDLAERARTAGVGQAHVSLTHHEGVAAAMVVLESA